MSDCLFCKIAVGEIPATVVYQDEMVMAFRDINPEAPTHVLVIPLKHFSNIEEIAADSQMSGHLLAVAARVAASETSNGHRVVFNTGVDGGQTVHHVHAHILGGRQLQWPPG
jgi:histidine triad (HIT) family protein